MQSRWTPISKRPKNQSTGTHLSQFLHEFGTSLMCTQAEILYSLWWGVNLLQPLLHKKKRREKRLMFQKQNEKVQSGSIFDWKPPPTLIQLPLCSCLHVGHLSYHLPGRVQRSVLSSDCCIFRISLLYRSGDNVEKGISKWQWGTYHTDHLSTKSQSNICRDFWGCLRLWRFHFCAQNLCTHLFFYSMK